jgi:preprotein translocase subunit SecB
LSLYSVLGGEISKNGVHVLGLQLVVVGVEVFTSSGFADGLFEVVLSNAATGRCDFVDLHSEVKQVGIFSLR